MLQDFVASNTLTFFTALMTKLPEYFSPVFLDQIFTAKYTFLVILNHYLFLFDITANSHLVESLTVQDYFRTRADDDVFFQIGTSKYSLDSPSIIIAYYPFQAFHQDLTLIF